MGENILLLGDAADDVYIYGFEPDAGEGSMAATSFRSFPGWQMWPVEGGVWLSERFLRNLGNRVTTFAPSGNADSRITALAELEPAHKKRPATKFRISKMRGFTFSAAVEPADAKRTQAERLDNFSALVLDDPGNALREARDLWGPELQNPPRLIVHKMNVPLADGPLWDALVALREKPKPFVVTVVKSEDLRRAGVPVARRLSWDRAVEDLRTAAFARTVLNALLDGMDALIVTFDCDGAAILYRDGEGGRKKTSIDLVFDPKSAEGDFDRGTSGSMSGRTAAFTALLASELAQDQMLSPVDLIQPVMTALNGLRHFMSRPFKWDGNVLTYPKLSTDALEGDSLMHVALADLGANPHQTISLAQQEGDLARVAFDVVRSGFKALNEVPYAEFRQLKTVDRDEIEGYRTISDLIDRHRSDPEATKPLSIAVFGPPGSGKSFGVKQLVPKDTTEREFNLTEIEPDDLPGIFHEIRDLVLKGERPLCFFDEFDTRGLDFLPRFLAPMQDGVFRHKNRVHPIGPAIFVFAGGTADTFGDFAINVQFKKDVKGPDFISRLSGFVNVHGPDPKPREISWDTDETTKIGPRQTAIEEAPALPNQAKAENSPGEPTDPPDPLTMLRRAIVLRSQLMRHRSNLRYIDDAVIRAFLLAPKFEHGTRSMERLVTMSSLKQDAERYTLSDLPPREQLALHVNPERFLGAALSVKSGDRGGS